MIQIIVTGKDKEKVMAWFNNDKEYQAIGRRLDKIDARLTALEKQGIALMAKADDVRTIVNKLTTDVTKQTTEIGGLKQLLVNIGALITSLKDQIANVDNIPQDIVDTVNAADAALNQNTDEIVKSVADNTPSKG